MTGDMTIWCLAQWFNLIAVALNWLQYLDDGNTLSGILGFINFSLFILLCFFVPA